jgi:c-di-GMP-binding flagellar brake protein YcgR
MDVTHQERRKFARIAMRAYASEHNCGVAKGSLRLKVQLIDISPGGARLKLADPLGGVPLARGDRISLDTGLKNAQDALNNLAAEVRWVGEIDFGVHFAPELDLTAGDLQRLLTP